MHALFCDQESVEFYHTTSLGYVWTGKHASSIYQLFFHTSTAPATVHAGQQEQEQQHSQSTSRDFSI
jgi:hypothetical protein